MRRVLGADDWLARVGTGDLLVTLAVALALGVRHATDPDHLTAIYTLAMTPGRAGARRCGRLGLAWGAGHSMTLLGMGLPIVAFGVHLPQSVGRAAELIVAALIVALAVRLIVRSTPAATLALRHARGDGTRSGWAAFGIGLVHGVGGSAGVGVVFIAGATTSGSAALALAVLALGTALSMGALSAFFGRALVRSTVRVDVIAPPVAAAAILFGAWYGAAALEAVPYPF